MMGKLLWPAHLSADYTLENMGRDLDAPSRSRFLASWFCCKSGWRRKAGSGALGTAIYWLGLVTVSNFIPLNRILADRFYYLPLAGVAMQLMALLLLMG
jgi:hypothetical protein